MIELGYNFLGGFKRHHFLYILGFLIHFRPINPFLYEMIVTGKNITEQEYQEQIRPISAYTSVIISLIICIFINFCVFNYFVSLACFAGVVLSVALWQGETVQEMQLAEGFYGLVVAAEIIYYSSIYVCPDVRKKDFASITSYIRGTPIAANLLGAIISQLIVSNGWLTFKELAFLTVPAFAHALLLVVHLPRMSQKGKPPDTFFQKISWFKKKTEDTFSNLRVLKWVLWSAFTTCGYTQVLFGMQLIWRRSQLASGEEPYNGAIEAISSFFSLLGVLLSGILKSHVKKENLLLVLSSLLFSALMFGYATLDNAWDCTIFYIIFNIVYHFVITTVSTMIAKSVYRSGSIGIAFSFIGFIYLIVNLTFICVFNVSGLNLTSQEQFIIYGGYHLAVSILIIVFWLLKL